MHAPAAVAPFHAEAVRCRLAQRTWAALSLQTRLQVIRRLRHELSSSWPSLCAAVEKDLGRPAVETLPGEVFGVAEACRYLERRARAILRTKKVPRHDRPIWLFRQADYIARRPRGIVGIIGTWNFPIFLNGVQILQALAAGNGVLYKPSEAAPNSADALDAWFSAAQLPADLLIKLPAEREAGRLLAEADVDHVVFTGHVSTGRKLAARLGQRLISSTLELSGCDAQIILDDADLDLAAKAAWFGCTLNGGQTCIAVRRSFVPASRYEAFIGHLKRLGQSTQFYRLMTSAQLEVANRLVADAVACGARVIVGQPHQDCAERFTPVILADATPKMAICREDSFAPIMAVLRYDDLDQAIVDCRRCAYDLGASVFTNDPSRAITLAEQLDAGMCTVNDVIVPTAHPATPFGGRHASGWGSTHGAEGLLEMTVPQVVSIRGGKFRPHYEPGGASKLTSLPFFTALFQWQYAPTWGRRLTGFFKLLAVLLGKK
jgi:acyl-CoA reductase-like NAD-dependent aldehyde dehydrogenase